MQSAPFGDVELPTRDLAQLGFDWSELCHLAIMSFESAFLPWAEKQLLIADAAAAIADLNAHDDAALTVRS